MDRAWSACLKLLFAASILSSCFLKTQAQDSAGPITLIPPDAIEGQSITLKPDQIPEKLVSCSWYRGPTVINLIAFYYLTYPSSSDNPSTGPAFTGRETLNTDCSLLIRDLSPTDSGNYTLLYQGVGIKQLGVASFTVLASNLNSCFLQTQAQESTIPIALIPPDVIQGQNITLRPEQIPAKLLSCSWYRGATMSQLIVTYYPSSPDECWRGDAYTGRETVSSDCSFHICDLSPSDSGSYTLLYTAVGTNQLGTASFKVVASMLSCCFPLSEAQDISSRGITFIVEPPQPVADHSVTITPEISTDKFINCRWYRGTSDEVNRIFTYYLPPLTGQSNGPAYSGREIGNANCGLHIISLVTNDSGVYTVKMFGPKVYRTGLTNIEVIEED